MRECGAGDAGEDGTEMGTETGTGKSAGCVGLVGTYPT